MDDPDHSVHRNAPGSQLGLPVDPVFPHETANAFDLLHAEKGDDLLGFQPSQDLYRLYPFLTSSRRSPDFVLLIA